MKINQIILLVLVIMLASTSCGVFQKSKVLQKITRAEE